MRRFLKPLLAALAVGALSVLATQLQIRPAAAVAFGDDDRRPVARLKGSEGGAVGLVFYQAANGQFAAGTGFLVSPCHVLTAYHVAAGGEKVDEKARSTFYVGEGTIGPDFPDLNRFADSSPAHPVAWGRYVRTGDDSKVLVRAQSVERNGWEDWALLELDKCFGAAPYSYGYLKLAPVTTRELMTSGASLAARSVGLPGDKSARSLWEDPTCRLIGQIYASGWQHDCITIPGNSGGPILVKDPVTGEPTGELRERAQFLVKRRDSEVDSETLAERIAVELETCSHRGVPVFTTSLSQRKRYRPISSWPVPDACQCVYTCLCASSSRISTSTACTIWVSCTASARSGCRLAASR